MSAMASLIHLIDHLYHPVAVAFDVKPAKGEWYWVHFDKIHVVVVSQPCVQLKPHNEINIDKTINSERKVDQGQFYYTRNFAINVIHRYEGPATYSY